MVVTRGEDTVFLGLQSTLGAAFGATGAVVHIIAVEPFVDGFTADAEATGEFTDIGTGLRARVTSSVRCSFTVRGLQGMGFSVN